MMVAAALTGYHEKKATAAGGSARCAAWAPRARAWSGRRARAAGLIALAQLVGCTSVAPQDDLAAEIQRYYAEHASEEDGRCATPEIASVTRRKVLGSSAEVTQLRVRYSYFDPSAPGASDWTRVLVAERPCTGVAERDFTLVSTDLGYKVMQMSGPVRAQP
jgi:hypothetical protein